MCRVCVSVLLSHTVHLELHLEKLVTGDEVKWMKEGGNRYYQLIRCSTPPEAVTSAEQFLVKYVCNDEARQLRGW